MKRAFFIGILSFLLIIFATLSLSFKASPTFNPIDYANPLSKTNVYLTATDLIEYVTGSTISKTESDFIKNTYGTSVIVSYDKEIINGDVTVRLISNTLSVSAKSKSYKTSNGTTVIWEPKSATLAGVTKDLNSANNYKATFEDVSHDLSSVSVKYGFSFDIPKNELNTLLNATFNEIYNYLESGIEEAKQQEYEEALAKYNTYLDDVETFNKNTVLYNEYLADLAKYNKAVASYNAYLEKVKVYNEALEKYNEYQKALEDYNIQAGLYNQYLKDLEIYNKAIEPYATELAEYNKILEPVNYQLASMELIRTSMTSLDRTIYSAVMGDTVSQVLSRKAELTQLSVPAAVIDLADTATKNLRVIFDEYFNLSTDEGKYNYYIANYRKGREIKKNLEDLCRALERLLRETIVRQTLSANDKLEKYDILVAQLALVSIAIDDSFIMNYEYMKTTRADAPGACVIDAKWKIDGKTISQILGNTYDSYMISTNVGKPTLDSYPISPLPPITKPVEVKKPTLPQAVSKPVAPAEVLNPGDAPAEVKKPTPPQEVKAPVPYSTPDFLKPLKDAYQSGELKKREELLSDFTIKLEKSFDVNFRTSDVIDVTFDDNGNKTIYSTIKGQAITYKGPTPKKEADADYKEYIFLYWMYEDGLILNQNSAQKSGTVKPYFKKVPYEYKVTWVLKDETYDETYTKGSIPSCKKLKDWIPFTGGVYQFVSWDKELLPVTGNVTYTASYNTKTSVNITWVLYDGTYVEAAPYDVIPSSYNFKNQYRGDGGIWVFDYFEPTLEITSADATYTAKYKFYLDLDITWVFQNKTISSKCEYGKTPQCEEIEPIVRDELGRYEYKSFDKEIVEAYENTTYTALYDFYPNIKVTYLMGPKTVVETHEYGTLLTDYPDVLESYDDDKGHFVFVAWNMPLGVVTHDVIYQALYDFYPDITITWVIGDKKYEMVVPYGTTPKPEYDVTIEETDRLKQEFISWDKAILPATIDTTYTAIYEITNKYLVTFVTDEKTVSSYMLEGSVPQAPSTTPIVNNGVHFRIFKGFDHEIANVHADITYTAIYEDGLYCDEPGSIEMVNDEVTIKTDGIIYVQNIVDNFINENTFSITINSLDEQMKIVLLSDDFVVIKNTNIDEIKLNYHVLDHNVVTFSVNMLDSFNHSATPLERFNAYIKLPASIDHYVLYNESDTLSPVPFEKDEDNILVTIDSEQSFILQKEYSIGIHVSSKGTITSLKNIGLEGEVIEVSLELNPGVKLESLYYEDPTGEKHNFDGSFVMPDCDIFLGFTYSEIYYTIVFMSDETVISTQRYKYGESIIFPRDPKKPSFKATGYKFVGWDHNDEMVTQDVTFKAVYEEYEVPYTEPVERKFSIVLLAKIVAGAVVVSLAGFITIKIVKKKKRKEN